MEAVKEVGFNLSTMDRQQAKGLVETLSDSYPLMAQMSTFGHYYESGRLPQLEEVEADAKGQKQYRVTENGREGEATVMSEEAARKYVQSRMEDMEEEEHARLADKFLADAMVTAAAERTDRFVVEEVGETMNADYFERMATAAQVRLDAGRTRDEVVPEVHPELTLGELVEQSAAWQERLLIARHDAEQKLGRKLSDEEWEERKARLASPVNRTRLRAEQTAGRRMRTLLRVARGKYSAMNVLEDVTEDNVVRYMESTGQDLGFFVDNLRELGKAMGNEWLFLRELSEGEQHGMMDVVEGLGKVVRGKVLADTAHKANGLPAWVNTFLDMVRRWVEQAAALMQLGEAVNKYMYADETTREKFAPEFREMVEKVTEQDVEFLRELQQERSREAEARILRAGATGYAPAAEATPTMDAAEAEHGEAVRQEQAAEDAYRERVDEDVSAALEMTSATNEDGAEEKTLQQQKGELHYVRHGDFESATVTRDPRAEDGSVGESAPREAGAADSSRDSDSGAAQGAGRGVRRVHGELGDSLLAENNDRAEDGLQGAEEWSRVRRNVLLTCKKHRFHADAAQKARENRIYAGELHELKRGSESAALFRECIEEAKVTQGLQGNCVYTYDVEDYAKMRLFLTPDCKAGVALKDDGDMVSVFKDKTLKDKDERRIYALIALAIQQGAKKADCYGHFLVELYGRFGFRAVAKDRFNAEYAPDPMKDEGVMREAFNREPEVGKPDVVYLVYVGNRESVLDEFDDEYTPDYAETLDYAHGENTYDACVKMQSEAVKQAEKWMRTMPSKEAREAALRKHLQRQSEGHTLSAEEAQKQGLFKDGVMETRNAVITTPAAADLLRGKSDMSSAIEDVQHASPHKFKKFDLEHIGSGEGAQAYGWGVYFSSNWGVNRSYHEDFSSKLNAVIKTKNGNESARYIKHIAKVTGFTQRQITGFAVGKEYADFTYENNIKALKRANEKLISLSAKDKAEMFENDDEYREKLKETEKKIRAYELLLEKGIYVDLEQVDAMNYLSDLHVEDEELMDWYEPEQRLNVRLKARIEELKDKYPNANWAYLDAVMWTTKKEAALSELESTINAIKYVGEETASAARYLKESVVGMKPIVSIGELVGEKYEQIKRGEELYKALVDDLGSPQAASEWLLERGIKGIRYCDEASRNNDAERSYNYVIFDPSVIEVKKVAERKAWSSNVNDTSVWEDYAGWSSSFAAEEMWDEESLIMDENLRQNIELAQGRKMKAKTHVRLSSCPPVLKMLGEKDADVVTEARILWKIANTHKLSTEETERALRGMEYPMFVIKDSASSYIFVPGVLATNNRQTLADVEVPLSLERTRDGKHYVMSAYALDSLAKIEAILNGGGKLVYSRYGKAALSTNGVQGVTPDFIRLMVERGFTSDTIIETEDVKADFSSAMAYIDEEQITRPLKAAARSFRANEAFVQQMLGEMRQCMNKLRRLSDRTRTDREEALATMGAVVQLVKSVRLYMPRGYRFSVAPYIRQLEGLSELATTGRIHLTQKITEADIKRDAREVRLNGEAANSALETGAYEAEAMADELAREYGDQTLNAVLEEVMSRVADGLREYAKDEVVKRMAKLLERAQVKKDKKTGKLKGGLMDAEGYREMDKVREAVQMDAGALADKLASLEAKAAKDDLTDAQRDELEGDMALYSTFGDVASMSLEQATDAYEALRGRIMLNKFAWDDKRADIRHARRGVINAVVRALGKAKPNEYHRAKVNKKPMAKAKHMGDLMANAPQTLRALAKVPGLGAMAENIAARMNKAGEMMKTWERERWVQLEALSRHCLGKSWRKCMDELHQQQGTGVAYERKIWRSVSIRSDYLKELLRMSPAERAEEMKRNRAAGGVLADAVYSERDIEALAEEMAAQRDGGRVRKTIETRYVEEVQREENLELSKGEALYIILMHEQPTYTERMEAQGYTREVIAGLREYVGQGWLDFGYGLREMFAEQGDKIAAVYEEVYGVPFPREENYFAARFVVDKVSDNTAEGLLAGMTGQPGVGTGWMKPRVTHNLDVDTNKDALQVFLQAVSMTDSWVATQDIVADLKAYMGDKEFSRAVTAKLGKDTYQNLKDWVKILEMGGVNDTVSMGAGQDMIRRVYSAGAISILGWRIQTWFRQFPAIANGVLGAHDVSVGEYLGAMSRLKHGTARMTFSRMLASDFMQNRYATDGDKMKEQAMRGDEQSSRMEGWLDAAMAPMGKIDAGLTAAGLVPVWNVYYERAMRQGCSEAEAEARAWEQTELAANMGSQPMGFLNKAKISQVRNPLARGVLFMLSENTNKVGLVHALWRSGSKKAAVRAWLIYGGLNALISCLLDALQGDPEEFEKGKWWEYVLSALYGPLASMPGVSEIVEGLGTAALNGVGYLVGSEELQNAKTRASIGRALIDFKGSYKAVKKLYELFTDDDEHSFYEYTRAASTISRMAGTGLGWMGNAAGYFSMLSSTLMNPLDFVARVWRNAMHYMGE